MMNNESKNGSWEIIMETVFPSKTREKENLKSSQSDLQCNFKCLIVIWKKFRRRKFVCRNKWKNIFEKTFISFISSLIEFTAFRNIIAQLDYNKS